MTKKVSKTFGILFLILELAMIPRGIAFMLNRHLSNMNPLSTVTTTMTFGSIALCILMSYASMSEHEDYPRQTFCFELMLFLCSIAPMTDLITIALDGQGQPGLMMFVNTVFYLIGAFIAYVLLRYEMIIIGIDGRPEYVKLKRIALILVILYVAATILNASFGYFFTISENGSYVSSDTFWLSYIIPFTIVAITAVMANREMRPGKQRKAFLYFWLFAAGASLIQIWQPEVAIQYTGYALSMAVIYINIQNELDADCSKIKD